MDGGDDGDSDDSSLIDSILGIPNRIAERLKGYFESITSSLTTFKDNVGAWFTNLGTSIGDSLTSVKDKITGALGDQLENIKSGFQNVKDNFTSTLQKLAEVWLEINTLPMRIREKIQELFEYFFVPDEELTNQRLDQIREKFAFIDSLAGYGNTLVNFLENASGAKAPVLTIKLGNYAGSFNYGNTDIVIDFAWYEPYKSTVDNIMAGIIWVVWLWHMYKRIPDIIAGNSMTTASVLRATRKDDN